MLLHKPSTGSEGPRHKNKFDLLVLHARRGTLRLGFNFVRGIGTSRWQLMYQATPNLGLGGSRYDVRYWHLADMRLCTAYVRFRV
jgi:hypothetical protein